ncbi:MAG: hypothetical protein NTV86_12085, partial [Planctomycetota bacterium]|nr:hypothetical protein [Planctomycetota bacterium]
MSANRYSVSIGRSSPWLESLEGRLLLTGDRFEPNDSMGTAHDFGSVGMGTMHENGLTITVGDVDYFKLTTAESGTLVGVIRFTNATGDLNFYLLDSGGNVVSQEEGTSNDPTVVKVVNPGEVYYIKVIGATGAVTQTYDLEIQGPCQNEPPTLGSVVAVPTPFYQGNDLTLWAVNAWDSDSDGVASVSFYRDANGNGVGEPGELLGTDTSGAGGWNWTGQGNWPLGTQTFLAQVTDNGPPARTSNWASTTVDVLQGAYDLITGCTFLTQTKAPGDSLDLDPWTRNTGTLDLRSGTAYDVQIRISLDDTWGNADDRVLYTGTWTGAMPVGQYYQPSEVTVTIPANTPDGDYHMVIKVNPAGTLPESDLTNNETWGGPYLTIWRPKPDLYGTSFLVQSNPVAWGQTFTVNYTIGNYGHGLADPTVTDFYFKAGWASTEYHVLQRVNTPAIPLNATYSSSISLTLPTSPPNGETWYSPIQIGMKVNADGAVNEWPYDPNNYNTFYQGDYDNPTLVSISDLAISSLSVAPTSMLQGDHPTSVSFTVTNNGPSDLYNGYHAADVYLSTDSTITEADTFLGRFIFMIGSLAVGNSTTVTATQANRDQVRVPIHTAAGTYYTGARVQNADGSGNGYPDANDANSWTAGNQVAVAAKGWPDVRVSAVIDEPHQPHQVGDVFALAVTIANDGDGDVWAEAQLNVPLYASVDAIFGNADDVQIGCISTNAQDLPAHGTRTIHQTVLMPALTPMSYYVGAYVDKPGIPNGAAGAIEEWDEDNNTWISPTAFLTVATTPTVVYHTQITDLAGNPVTAFVPGQAFQARVFVRHNRPEGANGGVSHAYADLEYAGDLVDWTAGSIVHGTTLNENVGGTIDEPAALVDEAGGSQAGWPPGLPVEQLLFTVNGTVKADAQGTVTFSLNAADLAGHETYLHGNNNPLEAVAIEFQQTTVPVLPSVPLSATQPVTFTDADKDSVTVTVKGVGSGRVVFLNAGDSDVRLIRLAGTDGVTTLGVTVRKAAGAGRTGVQEFAIDGSLKSLTASLADVTGAVTVDGLAGAIALGNLAGASIDVNGDGLAIGPKTALSITAGRVGVGNVNTHTEPIGTLQALDWADGLVSAPSIATLKITGVKANPAKGIAGVSGDFQADLSLSGSLGKATVAGTLAGATWDIGGAVASLTAGGTAGDWTLDAEGALAALTTGNLAGTLSAQTMGKVKATGALSASLTADGKNAKGVSIDSLTVARAGTASLAAPGGISTIATSDWLGGSIQAGWIGTLKAKANKALGTPGRFGANLTLTEAATPAGKATLAIATIDGDLAGALWDVGGAVASLTVKGKADHATVKSDGSMQAVSLGMSSGSDFLAGVGPIAGR